MAVTVEQLAEEMYEMVREAMGKKSFKATDLTKAMIAAHGEAEVTKDDCKHAIRTLIDSGRCVYSYFGGSFITLPHKEGAAPE
jgi:transcriptional regulator NrdR family protein